MIYTNATTKALFLVLPLLVVSHSNTACTDQEMQTLLSFLGSLSAPVHSLQSWNTIIESDCCKWEGITCNPSKSVSEISLPGKGLTGEISAVLSNLTNLSYLNLSNNFLSGSLPVELLSLSTSLKFLDVSFNKLSGKVSGFQNPLIQVLDISSNFLTGLLPIINATSLLSLNATNNSLTGTIPDYLCTNSPFLISLAISYNKFSGKISLGLENCTVLTDFHASSNNLVGSLPDELFKLASLQNLDLSTNFLTGSIPIVIGQLKKLRSLHLSSNNLMGMLPSAIQNCSDLRQLNLRENSLTGDLQFVNFTKLSSLELLDLYKNGFTGEIPESIYTCKNLNALRLSGNKLKGRISPAIGNLRALSFLSLATNNFVNITGAFENLSRCKNLKVLLISRNFIGEAVPIEPTWENGFENIQILSMQGCNFTGTIPTWISKLTKLEVLSICCNQFTGHIPDWLGNLSSLFYVDLSHNYLSGNIPRSITHLPSFYSVHNIKRVNHAYLGLPLYRSKFNLTFIQQYKQLTALPPTVNLGNNQLSGTIPQDIGQLTMLLVLDLSRNNLLGTVPASIRNLTNLELLDLSRNELTGVIPNSLTQLHFLSSFSVAFNNLSGPIPVGGQFNTFSNSSYEGNPYLCGRVVMQICSNPSHEDNKIPLTWESESFNRSLDRNTAIAVVVGFHFGVVAAVYQQFYRDFVRAWRAGFSNLHE